MEVEKEKEKARELADEMFWSRWWLVPPTGKNNQAGPRAQSALSVVLRNDAESVRASAGQSKRLKNLFVWPSRGASTQMAPQSSRQGSRARTRLPSWRFELELEKKEEIPAIWRANCSKTHSTRPSLNISLELESRLVSCVTGPAAETQSHSVGASRLIHWPNEISFREKASERVSALRKSCKFFPRGPPPFGYHFLG